MTPVQWLALAALVFMMGVSIAMVFAGIAMTLSGEWFGVIIVGFGIILTVMMGAMMYMTVNPRPAPLKPEGCYVLTHEWQYSGKTAHLVEVFTQIPCPSGVSIGS